MGNNCSPQKILAAEIANRIAATIPASRLQLGNVFGTLVIRRDADHSAMPAPNEGTLADRPAAVFDTTRLSPTMKTRNPAATQSSPFRKYFIASNAVAIIRPTASTAHSSCWTAALPTKVPARPNAPPIARPIVATMSRCVGVNAP